MRINDIDIRGDIDILAEGVDRLGELFLMIKVKEPEIEFHVMSCDKTNNREDSIVFKLPDVMAAPTLKVSVLKASIESKGVTATADQILDMLHEVSPFQEGFVNEVMNRDYILKNVTIRLVNAERNGHYADYVCRDYLNFCRY